MHVSCPATFTWVLVLFVCGIFGVRKLRLCDSVVLPASVFSNCVIALRALFHLKVIKFNIEWGVGYNCVYLEIGWVEKITVNNKFLLYNVFTIKKTYFK